MAAMTRYQLDARVSWTEDGYVEVTIRSLRPREVPPLLRVRAWLRDRGLRLVDGLVPQGTFGSSQTPVYEHRWVGRAVAC